MDVDIIKIEGSVELAPILNLADGIVDIVETGTTLRENHLKVLKPFMPISARFRGQPGQLPVQAPGDRDPAAKADGGDGDMMKLLDLTASGRRSS